MAQIHNSTIGERLESYTAPNFIETLSELDRFGAIIIGSLYFATLAIVFIYVVHKLVRKFLFPRLTNKRHALILIVTLHALVLVSASLLVLSRLGFDITVLARISLLLVIVFAAIIFAVAPYLPQLPFKLGDMVEIDGVTGNIKAISPLCMSSKDSGLQGITFKRDFQLIKFMFMQPSACSIADVAQPAFFA